MEPYDKDKAARVWQRVRESEAAKPDREELLSLIAQELADMETYLALSRRTKGQMSRTFLKMSEEERSHAACLKGMYFLARGTHAQVRSPQPANENTELALRRACGRELKAAEAYESRAGDPEFGPVFESMARQERNHSRLILEMTGQL